VRIKYDKESAPRLTTIVNILIVKKIGRLLQQFAAFAPYMPQFRAPSESESAKTFVKFGPETALTKVSVAVDLLAPLKNVFEGIFRLHPLRSPFGSVFRLQPLKNRFGGLFRFR
jgi:hypothetical protein